MTFSGRNVRYHPWIAFFFIFFSNTLISYYGLGLQINLWLLLLGIAFPFGLSLFLVVQDKAPGYSTKPFWQTEFLPFLPLWIWITAAFLLFFLDFYKFNQIPSWPLMDDGQCAFYAKELCQKWDSRLLFGNGQIEPLLLWCMAAFFKVFGISLTVMRLFPVLVALLTVGLGYYAAKKYFSQSLTFLFSILLGFNFWALVCSRQCHQANLVPIWQFCVLLLLSCYLRRISAVSWKWEIALGIALGAGFYIYAACPMMILAVLIAVGFQTNFKKIEKAKSLFKILAITALITAPMATSRLSSGGMSYILDLLSIRMVSRYLAALFFNGFGSVPYGPAWGGILNSLLSACFAVGIIESMKWRREPMIQWLALAGFLFFLPGSLTSHLELHRTVLLFPLLTLVACFGIQSLLSSLGKKDSLRITVMAAFLGISILLDLYHYFGPYQDWKTFAANRNHWISIQMNRAYQILETKFQEGDRFWVFDHLNNNNKDHTFEVAVYPLDASRTPVMAVQSVEQVALITNYNYKPFLEKRFPDAHWIWLCPDLPEDDGGLMLGWIPFNASTQFILRKWLAADRQFQKIMDESSYFPPHVSFEKVLKDLLEQEKDWTADPFLRSQWGERVALYTLLEPGPDPAVAVTALRKAVTGYPAANLYNTLGILYVQMGNGPEAEKAFLAAEKAPIDQTSAAQNLSLLQAITKKTN